MSLSVDIDFIVFSNSTQDATSQECVGAPISYTLRHLNGELALLQDCQTYVTKNIKYKAAKPMTWEYFDKLLATNDIYNQTEIIIDLSSIITFGNDETRTENRVLKIPPNVKDVYLKGPNQILSNSLINQLSIEIIWSLSWVITG